MENLLIRPIRREDVGALAGIHDAARREELRLAGLEEAFLPFSVAAEREGLFEYEIAVAEYCGRPVAFTAYSPDELAWLYVDPSYQRRGIGRALVGYVLKKHSPLTVEVLLGNTPARGLYESCGFSVTGIMDGRMPGNEKFHVRVWQMKSEISGKKFENVRSNV